MTFLPKSALAAALLFVAILWAASCGQNPAGAEAALSGDKAIGFRLLENNCFTCHSPNAGMESRVAPPMVAIKRHYIGEQSTKAEFTAALIAFLQNPSEANSRMPGAVQRFGLMPKMNFSEEDIRHIAAYLYDTEIEAPDWFEAHYQQERQRYAADSSLVLSPIEQGKQIAMRAKAVLGQNLMGAIKTRGADGAVEFCNTRALPLTDSMATLQGTEIRRVSDQPRNPANRATGSELAYIAQAKAALARGEDPKPALQNIGGKMQGYYPITTNAMCLQCHGKTDGDIAAPTLARIRSLYPDDEATGYGENALRGIWVVTLP